MDKICPACKIKMDNAIFHNIEADYCPKCFGLWFEKDELRQAKDDADKDLNWLDVDLWQNMENFIISRGKKICPSCRFPLYEVEYGKSDIAVDVCNICNGIWLDRGEFKKIMDYLKSRGVYDALNNHSKSILSEVWEIFRGPESIREEISDLLNLSKILSYKFSVQHPNIVEAISQLPK
jgi:Zn-finger nucleic acid-binding protein